MCLFHTHNSEKRHLSDGLENVIYNKWTKKTADARQHKALIRAWIEWTCWIEHNKSCCCFFLMVWNKFEEKYQRRKRHFKILFKIKSNSIWCQILPLKAVWLTSFGSPVIFKYFEREFTGFPSNVFFPLFCPAWRRPFVSIYRCCCYSGLEETKVSVFFCSSAAEVFRSL